LQPGDLYFEDVNGDGVVDDDDKGLSALLIQISFLEFNMMGDTKF
jgi:hypothetical protein